MTQSRTQNILMPMNITSIVVLVLARHQKISLNETLTGRVIKNNNKTEPASNSHSPVATWSQNERMKIAKQITDPLLAERFVNTLFCIFFFHIDVGKKSKKKGPVEPKSILREKTSVITDSQSWWINHLLCHASVMIYSFHLDLSIILYHNRRVFLNP